MSIIASLDDLKKLNSRQKVFDHIVEHLRGLPAPARRPETKTKPGQCFYRFEGMACAVGCLIPDSVYSPSFEGLSIRTLIDEKSKMPTKLLKFLEKYKWLLATMQSCHDEPAYWGPTGWNTAGENRLFHIAADCELIYTPVKASAK